MGLGRLENYVWENNKGDLLPLINTTVKMMTDDAVIRKARAAFWGRAKRMWQNVERDSEQQLRNIHQRGSKTHSTWKGINGQLNPLGSIDEDTCCVECNIDWRKHDTF